MLKYEMDAWSNYKIVKNYYMEFIMKRLVWLCLYFGAGAILVSTIFIGCAGTATSMVSVTDEEYNNSQFTRILVVAPYDNLEIRESVEALFAQEISVETISESIIAYKGIDLLPPLREYTREEISNRLQEKGIQAVLVAAVTDFWQTVYQTPEITITKEKTKARSTISNWGGLLSVSTISEGSSRTQKIPGIKFIRSNVKLDVRLFLYDLSALPKMIWRANSTTSGNYLASGSKVMRDAAAKIAAKLTIEGLLKFPGISLPIEYRVMGGHNYDIMLGDLHSRNWAQKSIFNKNGKFGVLAKHSLWDRNGIYSSDTSDCSACNPRANHPPIIVNQYGREVSKLSLNRKFSITFKTDMLTKFLKKEICRVR